MAVVCLWTKDPDPRHCLNYINILFMNSPGTESEKEEEEENKMIIPTNYICPVNIATLVRLTSCIIPVNHLH